MSVTSKSREEILEHLRVVLSDLFELKPEQIVPEAKLYTTSISTASTPSICS